MATAMGTPWAWASRTPATRTAMDSQSLKGSRTPVVAVQVKVKSHRFSHLSGQFQVQTPFLAQCLLVVILITGSLQGTLGVQPTGPRPTGSGKLGMAGPLYWWAAPSLSRSRPTWKSTILPSGTTIFDNNKINNNIYPVSAPLTPIIM